MGKLSVFAIAVLVLACSLPIIIASDPFDVYKLSHRFGEYRDILFDYYKLSLEWPKSVCNTGGSEECETPIKRYFTIHTLQPYYLPDNYVPPFNESRCNSVRPSPAKRITAAYLRRYGILDDMVKYWPNQYGYSDIEKNLEFWRYQWSGAGMCSSYPVYPDFYFKVALTYIKSIDLLHILALSGIHPNNEKYEASAFAKAIGEELGVKVQIRCNKDAKNVTQFYEAFLCIDRLNFLESCSETKYYGCSETEKIQFPSVGLV
ncbi:ribonuclease 1-like isoform X1 [Tripterygium wilfordii]|uniref:ribonuclease 1-like isoform X1 n=1 Tax=Tripterygium wilfordii TaxID=458696 RepID=UPI0018F82811|nr:ribonuclease 1-like isoform X1 [Tripterygium wilfordii]